MNHPIDLFTKAPAQPNTRPSVWRRLAISLVAVTLAILCAPPASAAAASGLISGRVVEDLTGHGISTDAVSIQGRTIRLFRDNGDKVFSAASDPLVATETTRRDGSYAFR